jgi:Tfp pilus assembly protein PilV
MGYIAALILVVTLLPLLGMLYMDVLQTKKEAKTQIEKMEKLRRDIEAQQRKDKDK